MKVAQLPLTISRAFCPQYAFSVESFRAFCKLSFIVNSVLYTPLWTCARHMLYACLCVFESGVGLNSSPEIPSSAN